MGHFTSRSWAIYLHLMKILECAHLSSTLLWNRGGGEAESAATTLPPPPVSLDHREVQRPGAGITPDQHDREPPDQISAARQAFPRHSDPPRSLSSLMLQNISQKAGTLPLRRPRLIYKH